MSVNEIVQALNRIAAALEQRSDEHIAAVTRQTLADDFRDVAREEITYWRNRGVEMSKAQATGTITEHERYRRAAGLSITQLAKAMHTSRPYVSQVENGHIRPSPSYRRRFARAVGVDENLIFEEASPDA